MDDNDLRLDGDAAGGLLNEVFPFEMTAAATTYSGCGAIKPVGELILYGHGMGAILGCAGCDVALIQITRIRRYYRLDLSGISRLQIGADIQ